MGLDKQPAGLLDTLNMQKVRAIFTHTYPYSHEHSRHAVIAVFIGWLFLHAVIAVFIGCLFFISSDNRHTLVQKLDSNIKWWSMYACLLGFFYFFSSPFIGKTIKPSYSNFSRWYIGWILVAALYHLPSFQSMGVDMRMNLSLFLTIYVSSILFLLVFHILFIGLWYIGLVARVAGRRPAVLTILQNCAVISVACCVFYSHCGNRAIMREKSFDRRYSGWFTLWNKEERNSWLAKFVRMNEFKDQVCLLCLLVLLLCLNSCYISVEKNRQNALYNVLSYFSGAEEATVPPGMSRASSTSVIEERKDFQIRDDAQVFSDNDAQVLVDASDVGKYIVQDTGNCSPRYIRCTLNQVPCTRDFLSTSAMQLALLVQPLALSHPSEEPIQVMRSIMSFVRIFEVV